MIELKLNGSGNQYSSIEQILSTIIITPNKSSGKVHWIYIFSRTNKVYSWEDQCDAYVIFMAYFLKVLKISPKVNFYMPLLYGTFFQIFEACHSIFTHIL